MSETPPSAAEPPPAQPAGRPQPSPATAARRQARAINVTGVAASVSATGAIIAAAAMSISAVSTVNFLQRATRERMLDRQVQACLDVSRLNTEVQSANKRAMRAMLMNLEPTPEGADVVRTALEAREAAGERLTSAMFAMDLLFDDTATRQRAQQIVRSETDYLNAQIGLTMTGRFTPQDVQALNAAQRQQAQLLLAQTEFCRSYLGGLMSGATRS